MDEMDELIAHRELKEDTKSDIEAMLLELEQLYSISGGNIVESRLYQRLIGELREISHTINAIDSRIGEIEKSRFNSTIKGFDGSENDLIKILDFVL